MEWLYKPKSLNLIELLPKTEHRRLDHYHAILSYLCESRVYDRTEREFINIHNTKWEEITSSTAEKPVRTNLLSLGVLESDRHYIRGEKSIGFRIAAGYARGPVEAVPIRLPGFAAKVAERRRERIKPRAGNSVDKALVKWIQRLEIDSASAFKAIPGLSTNPDSRDTARLAVRMLSDGIRFFTPDNSGRLHTPLTNLNSGLRKFLSIDGLPLVGVDLRNAQPFLLGAVLKQLKSGKIKPEIRQILNKTITKSKSKYQYPYDGCFCLGPDVSKFVECTASGKFYDEIVSLSDSSTTREEVKDSLLKFFMAKNNWHKYRKMGEVFRSVFPSVFSFLEWIKQGKQKDAHKKASALLHRLEAYFVIEKVVAGIIKRDPKIPLYTIHDSVYTVAECVDLVKATIATTAQELFGIVPGVKLETVWVSRKRKKRPFGRVGKKK